MPIIFNISLHSSIRESAKSGFINFESFSRRSDASRLTPRLQPLTNIWLGPNYSGQQQAGGFMTYIYLFSAIAFFILILACVNFVNLATARAGKRMKEVGVRKTTGASNVFL